MSSQNKNLGTADQAAKSKDHVDIDLLKDDQNRDNQPIDSKKSDRIRRRSPDEDEDRVIVLSDSEDKTSRKTRRRCQEDNQVIDSKDHVDIDLLNDDRHRPRADEDKDLVLVLGDSDDKMDLKDETRPWHHEGKVAHYQDKDDDRRLNHDEEIDSKEGSMLDDDDDQEDDDQEEDDEEMQDRFDELLEKILELRDVVNNPKRLRKRVIRLCSFARKAGNLDDDCDDDDNDDEDARPLQRTDLRLH